MRRPGVCPTAKSPIYIFPIAFPPAGPYTYSMAGSPPKFSIEVDHLLRRLTTTTAPGNITLADALDHLQSCEAAGALTYDQLADLRLSHIAFTADEIQRFARALQEKAIEVPFGRTALLVSGKHSFGMSRMFCSFAAPDYFGHVFESHAEALAWLGWHDSAASRAE